MHLFVDESGGTDPTSSVFLLAGVCASHDEAKHTARAVRKAMKASDLKAPRPGKNDLSEIKGNTFKPDAVPRLIAATPLKDMPPFVVYLDRQFVDHAWLFDAVPEPRIYLAMLRQLVSAVRSTETAHLQGVTIDRGRYKRAREKEIGAGVSALFNSTTRVSFSPSPEVPGLQLADLWANTAFRAFELGRNPERIIRDLPEQDPDRIHALEGDYGTALPLENLERFAPLETAGLVPDWLAKESRGASGR